jgi:NADH:ubiquinone reductase (non-electrogenic)
MLAYLGSFRGVARIEVAPGLSMRGLIAWFTWRTVYITKLGAWRNRMQVPFDWFKTLLLGRDIGKF